MLKRNRSGTSTHMGRSDHDVDQGDDIDIQLVLEMSGVFYVLEPEIFLNILSRVPLKSLSQCRWVCKSWCKLIQTPSFANIQFQWAVNNNSHCVFLGNPRKDFYLVDDQVFDHLETLTTEHKVEVSEVKLNFHVDDVVVVGYANGLVCFAFFLDHDYVWYASPFYIGNPITGEQITIPKSPNNKHKHIELPAFGFDPTTDEYKVMSFFYYEDEDGEYSSLEGEVYTLGSSDWRKIEDVLLFSNSGHDVVPVNGNIHWISLVSDSIIAFNVGAEKFHEIQPTPDMWQSGAKGLAVVDKHLCFLLHNENEAFCKPFEIWVMKDYGVQSSWVKKYSFNSNLLAWFQFGPNNVITLKNGEFLVLCGHADNYILIYNPKRTNFRRIKVNRLMESIFYMVMQVGSLLSPKDVGIPRRRKKV